MTTAPNASARQLLERVKTSVLAEGMRVTEAALEQLTKGGTEELTIHEYPTTGGITMVLEHQVYLNAPFDEGYCEGAQTVLYLRTRPIGLTLRHPDGALDVQSVLPLPGYLGERDFAGRPVTDVAMSHADRVRLSPIVGCAYDCGFCDLPAEQYTIREADQLLAALAVAAEDQALPARHVLISGGSPRRTHYDRFIETCERVITASPLPVDVMFSPMIDRPDLVTRLVDAGAAGFAINIEVFAAEPAQHALRSKYRTVRDHLERTIVDAVEALGREGQDRSLIIVGLEPAEDTLAGVDYLASLGCAPVLSPFRPAEGTRLRILPPPSAAHLTTVLEESRAIAARHGVPLGPDCVPCQHNTLTFPWDGSPSTPSATEPAG